MMSLLHSLCTKNYILKFIIYIFIYIYIYIYIYSILWRTETIKVCNSRADMYVGSVFGLTKRAEDDFQSCLHRVSTDDNTFNRWQRLQQTTKVSTEDKSLNRWQNRVETNKFYIILCNCMSFHVLLVSLYVVFKFFLNFICCFWLFVVDAWPMAAHRTVAGGLNITKTM